MLQIFLYSVHNKAQYPDQTIIQDEAVCCVHCSKSILSDGAFNKNAFNVEKIKVDEPVIQNQMYPVDTQIGNSRPHGHMDGGW